MFKGSFFLATFLWFPSIANAVTLTIDSASDWGYTASGFPASNAIDGSTSYANRWEASTASTSAVNLVLDLASDQLVTDVGISWGHGDDYSHNFEIRALASGGSSSNWALVYSGSSSGTTESIENYDITDVTARYIRIKVFSNSDNSDAQQIKEVELYSNGSSPVSSPTPAPVPSPTPAPVSSPTPAPVSSPTSPSSLTIDSAADWGYTVSGFPASNAIDGDTLYASRWAASTASTSAVNLVLDLGSDQDVEEVGIAWGHGDDYTHTFEIRSLTNNGPSSNWALVYQGTSSGTTEGFEVYDITDVTARYIRIKVFSNSANLDEQEIKEVELYGTAVAPIYGLDPNEPPSENFDLLGWYLSVPIPDDDGYASDILENQLSNGYESQYFYTGSDGAMVFWTDGDGVRTSANTQFVRSELRGMLRRGNTSIKTKSYANNWAFSSIPSSSYSNFGGIDGTLTATLAVDHVATTGTTIQQNGKIVIGQIHAEHNEPCRLYYHKLPGNTNGAVYVAHELSVSEGGEDYYYNLLGNMVASTGAVTSTSNPSDGMALGEKFSYSIVVDGDDLTVTISQNGSQLAQVVIDMTNSGYDDASNYMYFKAGLYLQDNTMNSGDYGQVSFYALDYSHD